MKVEAILPTDPGEDGIAIGLDGQIYSDTAITAAYAAVGQLGPISPKVAICHFPPQERAQFQVCCSSSSHRELCTLLTRHVKLGMFVFRPNLCMCLQTSVPIVTSLPQFVQAGARDCAEFTW